METKRQQQLKTIVNNLTPIYESIWKVTLANWRFILVNVVGLVGVQLALILCNESYQKMGGDLPPEYYHYMFIGSLAFAMLFIYQTLKIDGVILISKVKKEYTNDYLIRK